MQPITKQEFNYLINHNILKINKIGNYKDPTGDKKLVVTGVNKDNRNGTSSSKNSKQKQRYVQDVIYNRLLEEREKDKKEFDISLVKDNQRCLFSSVSSVNSNNDSVL